MNVVHIFSSAVAICVLLASSGCDVLGLVGSKDRPDEVPIETLRAAPDEVPIETLRAAPDALLLDDKELVLRTFMWRDFMPIAPPDGQPLIAIFRVVTADSTDVPDGMEADRAWVIHEDDVWDARFSDEETPPGARRPYQLYRVARDGPKFGPDVYVDAVVRLIDGDGRPHLLRAEQQYIMRTD